MPTGQSWAFVSFRKDQLSSYSPNAYHLPFIRAELELIILYPFVLIEGPLGAEVEGFERNPYNSNILIFFKGVRSPQLRSLCSLRSGRTENNIFRSFKEVFISAF